MSTQKETATYNGGPRTTAGKLRASRNARKDGLLAAEFVFSAEEQVEFDDLRLNLSTELKPDTAVLALLFEIVVASAWRIKLASRCEQRAVTKHLQSGESARLTLSDKRYKDSAQTPTTPELQSHLRLLEQLREHFERCSYIPAELEEPIVQASGADFWKMLAEWQPVSYHVSCLVQMAMVRTETFNGEPLIDLTPEEERKCRETDSRVHREMILKIIDHEMRHVRRSLHGPEQTGNDQSATSEQPDRLDLYLRYHTAARREFYRALREYRETKARSG